MTDKDDISAPSWSVYIALCADNSYYTGISTDITRRIKQHNAGKGAKYTAARRPIHAVYSEICKSHSAALKREYAIKQMSRAQKQALVSGI